MKNLNMTITKYNFIMKNIIFDEPKKEKEIFELVVKGYNNVEIGSKIGMSSKTVYRRKKELYKKIVQLF